MGTILLLACLAVQDDRFRVDGSPFVLQGEQVELQAVNIPKDTVVVWRLADGPAGAIETRPAMNADRPAVSGVPELTIRSTGHDPAEFRFSVTAERKGIRVAFAEFRLRVGPLLTVRVWCRAVENPAGGTARGELLRDNCRRKGLEGDVNRFLRPMGIAVALEPGTAVQGPDWWFDKEGRFQPIGLKDGKKANSHALNDLVRNDLPTGLNVYFVRDCYWEQIDQGFERRVTAHELLGVGLKEGRVVLDDDADAASLAHELGHALGLDDLKEKTQRDRLMYWIRRDRSDVLVGYDEMKWARDCAQTRVKNWVRGSATASIPGRR
ncbi:MAG TPA: hypothetical protein VE981_07410 [Planctomycetota bacterium]|nr:hypothetical protein [Planctomycetota bacterium]